MKNNNKKKANLQKELETLKRRYIFGNKDAWAFVEYHIQTIQGLDEIGIQVLIDEMKVHLEINK